MPLRFGSSSAWDDLFDAVGVRERVDIAAQYQALPELDANAARTAQSSLAAAFGRSDLSLMEEEGIYVVDLDGGDDDVSAQSDSGWGAVFGPIIDRTLSTLGEELDSHLGPKIDSVIDSAMDMVFGEDDGDSGTEEGGDGEGDGDEGSGDGGGDDGGGEASGSSSRVRRPGRAEVIDILDAAEEALGSRYDLGDTATHEVGHVAVSALADDDDDVIAPRRHRPERDVGRTTEAVGVASSPPAALHHENAEPLLQSLPEVGDEVLVSFAVADAPPADFDLDDDSDGDDPDGDDPDGDDPDDDLP